MPKKELSIKVDDDVQDGEVVETQWDIKKIGIGLALLALMFIGASYVLFPVGGASNHPDKGVLGISAESDTKKQIDPPPLPNSQDIQQVIDNAKDTLSGITSDNLVSSQAAIQQIITDLQVLQGKKDAKAAVCAMICGDK
ncbi:MAG TPA: hypothetical protein VHE53_03720 [Patescibacteria group bacterium]|nr:hypothetical protein [Patescibacteria group bacterium]